MSDFKERVNKLRNGLEDDYWYGEEDEKTFEELVRKSEAFEKTKVDIRKQINHLYKNMFSEKAQTKIDLLEGILMTMNDNEFDAKSERGENGFDSTDKYICPECGSPSVKTFSDYESTFKKCGHCEHIFEVLQAY